MATIGFVAVAILGFLFLIIGSVLLYATLPLIIGGFSKKDIIGSIIMIMVLFALSFLCFYNVFKHLSIKLI